MNDQEKKGSARLIALIIFVILIVLLAMTNRWLAKQTGEIVSEPTSAPIEEPVSVPPQEKKPKKIRHGEVIREVRLSPDRKVEISVFYQSGVEIARYKSSKGEIYDLVGEIPDGKVKFINKSNKTYGVEYFRNGKRHGSANLFYSDDVLRQEFYYQYGKLMTSTEYYHDGTVRMEQDYSDAREYTDDPEVGIGKVFTRHGTLKFEWFLVNSEPIGFKKSYNQKGELVDTVYFDEYGQVIEPEKVRPGTGASLGTDTPVNTGILSRPDVPPAIERPPKQIFVPAD